MVEISGNRRKGKEEKKNVCLGFENGSVSLASGRSVSA
jgi:hypothetical protein